MNLNGISRIEEYFPVSSKDADHDPMLQRMYDGLDQSIFTVDHKPEPIKHVDNLEEYNEQEGLALSPEEIEYLHKIEKELGRPLTDSEISVSHRSTLSTAATRFRRCVHHRRQGDGVVALQHDQEDDKGESSQDSECIQG